VRFPQAFGETGTFMVAWGADDQILVSSSYGGSGWVPLRRYDPATLTTAVLGTVRQNTMLTPSADRQTIGLAESNISSGPVHAYSVSQGAIFATENTNWFTFEVAVSSAGNRFVVPTYNGAFVYELQGTSFVQQTTLGQYATYGPLSAVFSPTQPRLYTAEWGSVPGVKIYDTNTWQVLDTLDAYPFAWSGNFAMSSGRIEISPDGRLLVVAVNSGVRLYRCPGP